MAALSFSTGHGGALLDRTRGLLRHYRRNRRFAAWDWRAFADSRAALERRRPLEGARVLDLGCGQRFFAALLFHSFGARATGIDTDVVAPAAGGLAVLRRNGLERFAKTLVRRLLFDRAYYAEMRRRAGRPLRFDGLDLRVMDARSLAFPDAHFDLVHSCAVFEHLVDVPRVLAEVERVLKPGGVASIVVHLFPSLSGGHHPEWALPDEEPSERVPPWDHLLGNRFPSDAYLNRWRERQFLETFRARFEVESCVAEEEGAALLTPERERALAGWSREDLLRRAIRVVLRRRN